MNSTTSINSKSNTNNTSNTTSTTTTSSDKNITIESIIVVADQARREREGGVNLVV